MKQPKALPIKNAAPLGVAHQRLVSLLEKIELKRKKAEGKWVSYYKSEDYQLALAYQREAFTLEDIQRELTEINQQANAEVSEPPTK